uniref:HAD hydrolase-like protein n=1 Tax=Prevotella sp. TaxID=59823 RepID=UPI003FEEDD3B
MKKIVILDFDGTIADTKPVILNTFHRTFDAMHLPQHSDEEIAATIGLPSWRRSPCSSRWTRRRLRSVQPHIARYSRTPSS